MVGVFPVNKKILGIWGYVWFFFLIFGVALIGTINGISGDSLSESSGKLSELKGAGSIGISLGLFVLLAISFWDVVLFLARADRPLRRLYKSIIFEEKAGALRVARNFVRAIVFLGFLNLFFVLWGIIIFLIKKESTIFGSTVKNAIEKVVSISGQERWWMVGTDSVIFFIGLISLICKFRFMEKWRQCVCSHPTRGMGYLVCSRPGVTSLFYNQYLFGIFLMSGFLFFIVLGVATGNKSTWFAWMKVENEEFSGDKSLYQGVLAGLFLIGVLTIVTIIAHHIKNKRDYHFALERKGLYVRDFKELVEARRYVSVVDGFSSLLIFLWVFSVISVLFSSSALKTLLISQGEKIMQISSCICLGLFTVCIFPHFVALHSVRWCFHRCNRVDISESKKMFKLIQKNMTPISI